MQITGLKPSQYVLCISEIKQAYEASSQTDCVHGRMGTTTLIQHPFSPIKLAWVILFKSTRLEVAAVYCGPSPRLGTKSQVGKSERQSSAL